MIRVFIVEDHPVMRETLCDYLGRTPDIEVCGTAASAETAMDELDRSDCDVLLLDLSLPGRNGLELLEELRGISRIPCVIVSGHGEQTYVRRALAIGADGYVLKGEPAQIPAAVRSVGSGEPYLAPSLRHQSS